MVRVVKHTFSCELFVDIHIQKLHAGAFVLYDGVYDDMKSTSSKTVYEDMPDNRRTITDRDAPIGSLPTPEPGKSATLTPGSLPKNVSTNPNPQGMSRRLTDDKGNLVPTTTVIWIKK